MIAVRVHAGARKPRTRGWQARELSVVAERRFSASIAMGFHRLAGVTPPQGYAPNWE
jgi:hypothetical protein